MMKLCNLALHRIALTAVMGFILLGIAAAQEMEQNVKAAYLYNFTKYVTWPAGCFESNESPIVIGIVGTDSLGGALDSAVSGKTVDGRRLVVKHYRWNQDLSTCEVLFVPAGEMGNAALLERIKRKPVLTVGESPGFARRNGIVNFVIEANRVRFEINASAARDSGITVSSKLLSLAKVPG
jgi:hypothetical protein